MLKLRMKPVRPKRRTVALASFKRRPPAVESLAAPATATAGNLKKLLRTYLKIV